jgi:hypothetical protein
MERADSRHDDPGAALDHLIRVDHDAVQAYTLAITAVERTQLEATLRRFRRDHERRIAELGRLGPGARGLGADVPRSSGPFKLAVQGVSFGRGDRALLACVAAFEAVSHECYRAAASGGWSDDVAAVLARAAAEEERHQAWAAAALADLGGDERRPDTAVPAGRWPAGGEGTRARDRRRAPVAERVRATIRNPRNLVATGAGALAGAMAMARALRR